MASSDPRDRESVALAILQQLCTDLRGDGLRELAHYQARFPGFEDVVATEFAAIAEGRVTGPSNSDTVGRYRTIGELGRGGMGVVFEVHDRELDRHLAKKVILDPAATPAALRRFLNEARVTARLEHPGIVPVHDIGIDERGRAYFTMAMVRGQDLSQVLRAARDAPDPPSPGRTRARILQILVRVCEAVAFAHSRGVVHRDLKPSNIMVGPFGEAYVMDWGLARTAAGAHPSPEEAGSPPDPVGIPPSADTLAGDVLGTPAYMAPEQARGDLEAVDARSDVYALGAILYRLLAGHAPYATGPESQRDTVLERVLTSRPDPLPAGIPDELVAICNKAMAREPEHRYASAVHLGDDLRAFLELRVVSAHEHGRFADLRKWVRRNRGLTAAAALAVLALTAGLVTSLVFQRQAEDRYQVALGAIEQLLERVGRERLANVPQAWPVRRELLGEAVVLLGRLLADREDPAVRRLSARTAGALGYVEWELGNLDAAETRTLEALAHWDRVLATAPDPTDEIARVHDQNRLGMIRGQLGRPDESLRVYEQSRRRLAELGTVVQDDVEALLAHANLSGHLALAYSRSGRLEEAMAEHDRELAALRRAAEVAPGDDRPAIRIAGARSNQAVTLGELGRGADALAAVDEAIAILEGLGGDAGIRRVRETLGAAWMNRHIVLLRLDRTVEADDAARRCVAIYRAVAGDNPSVRSLSSDLAGALYNLGNRLYAARQLEPAKAILTEAVELQRDAFRSNPGNARYRDRYHRQLSKLIHVQQELLDFAALLGSVPALKEPRPDDPEVDWDIARVLARQILLLERAELRPDERASLEERFRDGALEALVRAIDGGFRHEQVLDHAHLRPLFDTPLWLTLKSRLALER